MSAEVVSLSDGVLTVRFSGKLKLSGLRAVQKVAGDAIKEYGQLRVLCLAEDFLGWEKSGGWGDVSFQAEYDPFIEKIAIVGDRKWEDFTLLFTSKGIRRVPIEYFAPTDLAKARAWLAAAPERVS
jgi:hypothetical protein